MSKAFEMISSSVEKAKERIIEAVSDYVMEVGRDFDQYDSDEYGIDEEDGEKVLKVLDVLDNGGCCFPWTPLCQVEDDCGYYYYAFQCLYVTERNGVRDLMYYLFVNDGFDCDMDLSEPDHKSVCTLPLEIIDKLLSFIGQYDKDIDV